MIKMTEIKTSEFNELSYNDKDFTDYIFEVDHDRSFRELNFINCIFNLTSTKSLTFYNCDFKDCVINGFENIATKELSNTKLEFNSCLFFENIILNKAIGRVDFINVTAVNLTDKTTTNLWHATSSRFEDSCVSGSCTEANLNGVTFVGRKPRLNRQIRWILKTFFGKKFAFWKKEILLQATCTRIVFDKVEIDPYFLSTKANQKNHIDLSNAIFTDEWSKLRKSYSGLSLFIVFLLTTIFFLPLIVKYFLLSTTSDLVSIERANLPKIQFWEALLYGGKEGHMKYWYMVLTLVLLFYNVARIWLTISIAKLREEEKFLADANFQLTSLNPEKYKIQALVSKALQFIFIAVFIYSGMKFIDAIQIEVIDLNSLKIDDLLNSAVHSTEQIPNSK